MEFIYYYCFILDFNEIIDCVDDNKNKKTNVQSGDCDYPGKLDVPVIYGKFSL